MTMRITKTLTALALVVSAGAATAVAMPPLEPVLGAKAFAPKGGGFGTAYPTSFFNGDDERGYVGHIHWSNWSSSTAIGSGRRATGPQTTVAIQPRAHDLGTCPGSQRPAYRHLAFRQRTRSGKFGPWHDWAGGHSICSQP